MAAPRTTPTTTRSTATRRSRRAGRTTGEMIISGKRKGKKKEMTLDESNRVVDAMLARMEEAARLDDEALKAEAPATQKAALATEVVEFLATGGARRRRRRAILYSPRPPRRA